MGNLDGKVALITGVARGQGRSHAVASAREGADLILVDICKQLGSIEYAMADEDDLDETVRLVEEAGAKVVSAAADVRDGGAIAEVVKRGLEELGRLDIVGANAGISTYGPLWEISQETWDEMIGVNLTGVWQTVRATVPRLIEQGEGGSIICTSSCAGLKGFANAGHYSAAKHGVVGLVKTLAQEVGPYGIRANAMKVAEHGRTARPADLSDRAAARARPRDETRSSAARACPPAAGEAAEGFRRSWTPGATRYILPR